MKRKANKAHPREPPSPASLALVAVKAKAAKERHDAAKDLEQGAEERLLTQAVEAVRPALPSICDRKAVILFRGEMGHPSLLLLDTGTFALQWKTHLNDRIEGLTIASVLNTYTAEDVIEALALILETQIAGREGAAEEMEKRAEKFRAVAKLLEE